MLKVLVTFARPDGSFDEVGMSNRTVVWGGDKGKINEVVRTLSQGRETRLEWFTDTTFYGEPDRVTFLNKMRSV